MSTPVYSYTVARNTLAIILEEFRILSGDKVGHSDATWQDVAGTCSVNLRYLATLIDQARAGRTADGPAVFPSPSDLPEVE